MIALCFTKATDMENDRYQCSYHYILKLGEGTHMWNLFIHTVFILHSLFVMPHYHCNYISHYKLLRHWKEFVARKNVHIYNFIFWKNYTVIQCKVQIRCYFLPHWFLCTVQLQQRAHRNLSVWCNLTRYKVAAKYRAQRDIQNVFITSLPSRSLEGHFSFPYFKKKF